MFILNELFDRRPKPNRCNKIVSLSEAISEIKNGDVIMLGSFIDTRRPMAAAYEIARQQKRGLILLAQCTLAEDILVGVGCAAAWRGCYTGIATFGLSPATLRKTEDGTFFPDEIGHLDIIHGAMGAMVGSPFVGTRATLGSDVLNENLDRNKILIEKAGNPAMIPQKKFILMEDPFFNLGTVKLLPAMPADIAIIHTQMAGEQGTASISGSLAFDHYFIHAAKKVIITTEKIVPEEYLRREPNRNQIPCTAVDMIAEVPWGAHPSQLPGFYDTDIPFIRDYVTSACTHEGFDEWAGKWIYDVKSHDQYLDKLGASRLERLRCNYPWGFRSRADMCNENYRLKKEDEHEKK